MTPQENDKVAEVSTTVAAPVERVWQALTNPEIIREYMFGTTVETTWQEQAPIFWRGEWQGQEYEDKGTVLEVSEPKRLSYTHFSPLTGEPDVPENYHTVVIDLTGGSDGTKIRLRQDNNSTEEAKQHSESNWQAMLNGLKQTVESERQ